MLLNKWSLFANRSSFLLSNTVLNFSRQVTMFNPETLFLASRAVGTSTRQRKLRKVKKMRQAKYSDVTFNKADVIESFNMREKQGDNELNLKSYEPVEAIKMLKEHSTPRKFDESVDITIRLMVDPTRGDQLVRGTCVMPAGLGKKTVIAVFTTGNSIDIAKAAGADIIGDENTIKEIIEGGRIEFDKCFATPEVMGWFKTAGRVLGPKGLIPNVKTGTLIKPNELEKVIADSKAGRVEFRVSKDRLIMAPLGKRSFTEEQLATNFFALIAALQQKKPESIKGRYFAKTYIRTSMGLPWRVNMGMFAEVKEKVKGF